MSLLLIILIQLTFSSVHNKIIHGPNVQYISYISIWLYIIHFILHLLLHIIFNS